MGWTIRVQFTMAAVMGFFSPRHRIRTGSGAHPASYTFGTGGYYLGDKTTGAWMWSLSSTLCGG